MMVERTGRIFDIQRYCAHDGPGVRTTVFFKGCHLRCPWCHNPEGLNLQAELLWNASACIHCSSCESVCPHAAIQKVGDRKTVSSDCDTSGQCVEACPSNAWEIKGKQVTVSDLMAEVEKDRAYYDETGGGVTVSGGEPLLQADFVADFLAECQRCGIHTAIETCGDVPWPSLEKVLRYTNLVLYDIKHLNPSVHRSLTGVSNERILENFRRLRQEIGTPTIVRIPVVPACNDSEDNLRATAEWVAEMNPLFVNLLPYHPYGESKYESVGIPYRLPGTLAPSPEQMGRLQRIVEENGLSCIVN